jgi:N-methylhydantoinase B
LKRDAAKVAKDVDRGLVTLEGAKRYGVVVKPDMTLDNVATNALRQRIERERGELKLFNFGGTVEELKARCKAETGFDPPRAPVFQKRFRSGSVAAAE